MERVELTDEDLHRIEALAGDVDVSSLVEELPQDQRQAVTARVVEERDYDDIAGEMEISTAGVRKRVSRGLAVLRGRAKEMQ
jgi:RNA polymerase sigma-70 factor (ECF subfamily)